MNARRAKTLIAACGTLPLLFLAAGTAHAHGSMQTPVSRVYGCYQEGPEHPKSAACQAAVAASGTQAFYDWMGVRIGDAAGRHRDLIPDGKLCSAGSDEYKGLDLPRADWPATSLPGGGGSYTFQFRGTAPHKGSFELYVTKDGYDPTKPLAWSDLEPKPFYTATDPSLVNGSYVLTAQLPKKQGRHLIYAIWQRSDSPEAFYSCSDVVFGGAGSATTGGSGSAGSQGSGSGASTAHASAGTGTDSQMSGMGDTTKTVSGGGGSPATAGTQAGATSDGSAGSQAAAPAQAQLAHTGASRVLPLTGTALAVLGLGGAAVYATRRRGARRR